MPLQKIQNISCNLLIYNDPDYQNDQKSRFGVELGNATPIEGGSNITHQNAKVFANLRVKKPTPDTQMSLL
jgi:hypothetical protein